MQCQTLHLPRLRGLKPSLDLPDASSALGVFISILPLKQLVAQFLNDDVGSFAMMSLRTWARPAVVASRLNAEDDPSSIVSMSDFCVLVSWRHWEGIHGRVK
jgi:hypothetical protein